MSSQLWSELEQGSFSPDEFVERLAWRVTSNPGASGASPGASVGGAGVGVSMQSNNASAEEDFDAQALHDTFLNAIQELNLMQEKQKKKCQTLEEKCLEEETAYRKRVVKALAESCVTAFYVMLRCEYCDVSFLFFKDSVTFVCSKTRIVNVLF